MAAENPKFCVDCAHYGGANVCTHPSATEAHLDLVTGETVETRLFASQQRHRIHIGSHAGSVDRCGPQGQFWEADTSAAEEDEGGKPSRKRKGSD